MTDGPTVVGSIVGTLRIDDSDWDAKLDRAEAKARELGLINPKVKVEATVENAIAALEAVTAAEKKLEAANAKSDAATQRALLSQKRLSEVQTKRGRTALQVSAAELALTEATARSDAAAEKAIAAEDGLSAARASLIAITDALDLAEGTSNDEENRGNEIKATTFKRTSAIVAAVAALIPLLGPLAAYTVGVSGGLLGMGVVGVLAILGIKNAMAQGNATGQQYSAGLQILRGDLNELSQTAAVGMLGQFDRALSTIQASLPQLNAEVHDFAGVLGGTGNAALSGAINFLHVLNPLFVQAGMYVGAVALAFEKWTSGQGIKKFASYAEQQLPVVAGLLGNLASTALKVVESLAPAGTALITFIEILSNIVRFFASLGPGFAIVVAGATAGAIAFKLFGTAVPLIQAVTTAVTGLGVAEQASLGPIGLVVAGITALIAILGVSASATQSAAQGADTYAAAIEADNGVIGENIKLQAAKNLQDAGALDNATKLGIKTNDLVQAALGNHDAQSKVNQTLADQKKKLDEAQASAQKMGISTKDMQSAQVGARREIDNVSTSMGTQAEQINAGIKAYNQLQESEGGTTIKTKEQLAAQQALADSYGVSLSVYEGAVNANKKTAAQAALTTIKLQLENDAASLLNNTFTILNGGSLDVAQAQTGLAAANNTLTQSFKQNGHAIDGTTAAAVANQQALESQVGAAQSAAEAVAKQTKSTVAGKQAYLDSKAALEKQLRSQGDLTGAVQAYIDKLYNVANFKVPPTTFDADTSRATAKLAALQSQIDQITKGHSITVDATGQVSIHTKGSSIVGHADGGTVGGAGSSTSDSNLVRLSVGEEVIKASSAGQARPFLKAFNANPGAALSAVTAGASGSTPVNVRVINKSGGVAISDLIELHIEHDGQWQAIHLDAGVSS